MATKPTRMTRLVFLKRWLSNDSLMHDETERKFTIFEKRRLEAFEKSQLQQQSAFFAAQKVQEEGGRLREEEFETFSANIDETFEGNAVSRAQSFRDAVVEREEIFRDNEGLRKKAFRRRESSRNEVFRQEQDMREKRSQWYADMRDSLFQQGRQTREASCKKLKRQLEEQFDYLSHFQDQSFAAAEQRRDGIIAEMLSTLSRASPDDASSNPQQLPPSGGPQWSSGGIGLSNLTGDSSMILIEQPFASISSDLIQPKQQDPNLHDQSSDDSAIRVPSQSLASVVVADEVHRSHSSIHLGSGDPPVPRGPGVTMANEISSLSESPQESHRKSISIDRQTTASTISSLGERFKKVQANREDSFQETEVERESQFKKSEVKRDEIEEERSSRFAEKEEDLQNRFQAQMDQNTNSFEQAQGARSGEEEWRNHLFTDMGEQRSQAYEMTKSQNLERYSARDALETEFATLIYSEINRLWDIQQKSMNGLKMRRTALFERAQARRMERLKTLYPSLPEQVATYLAPGRLELNYEEKEFDGPEEQSIPIRYEIETLIQGSANVDAEPTMFTTFTTVNANAGTETLILGSVNVDAEPTMFITVTTVNANAGTETLILGSANVDAEPTMFTTVTTVTTVNVNAGHHFFEGPSRMGTGYGGTFMDSPNVTAALAPQVLFIPTDLDEPLPVPGTEEDQPYQVYEQQDFSKYLRAWQRQFTESQEERQRAFETASQRRQMKFDHNEQERERMFNEEQRKRKDESRNNERGRADSFARLQADQQGDFLRVERERELEFRKSEMDRGEEFRSAQSARETQFDDYQQDLQKKCAGSEVQRRSDFGEWEQKMYVRSQDRETEIRDEYAREEGSRDEIFEATIVVISDGHRDL